MDEDEGFSGAPPPAPDDRLWRHPSEVARSSTTTASPADRRMWRMALAGGIVGAVLSGLIVGSVEFLMRDTAPRRSVEKVAASSTELAKLAASGQPDVVGIADRLRPSLVELLVVSGSTRSSGSGIIFRDDGHILTNAHVLREASEVVVVLASGRQLKATVVGRDTDTDVAVVKITANETFPSAVLGSATALKVGQPAVAIGSPLGLSGGPSVSVGIVGALGRQVNSPDSATPLYDMIQTDAPIAPGSSGGALLDANGHVIGITTAISVGDNGSDGLGFAIPVDVARHVAEQLITTGSAEHPWVGLIGEDLDGASAAALKVDGGAVIKKVVSGGPADAADIKVADVVVSCNDYPVTSMAKLVVAVRQYDSGTKLKLGIMRNGQLRTAEIVLEPRPTSMK